MAGEADVQWIVEFDASESLAALETSLDQAKSKLDTIDESAKATGKAIADALTPPAPIDIGFNVDTSALEQIPKVVQPISIPTKIEPPKAEPTPTEPPKEIAQEIALSASTLTPEIERARLELESTKKTSEGVDAALTLAFRDGKEAVLSASAAEKDAAAQIVSDWQAALGKIEAAFNDGEATAAEALRAIANASSDAGHRLNEAFAEASKPKTPELIQPEMASEGVRRARDELAATQKSAEGVAANIRLAGENLDALKAPDSLKAALGEIEKDYLAQRATAEETIRAVQNTQKAALSEAMEAKRREAEAFREAERSKREETAALKKDQAEHTAMLTRAGAAASTTAAGLGSAASMMLSFRQETLRARGETDLQLFGLRQMQEVIPHTVSLFSGASSAITGGIPGLISGIPSMLTGLVGIFTTLGKPLPQQKAEKEADLESVYQRIQRGAISSDDAQRTRLGMLKTLESIDRSIGGIPAAEPLVRSGP